MSVSRPNIHFGGGCRPPDSHSVGSLLQRNSQVLVLLPPCVDRTTFVTLWWDNLRSFERISLPMPAVFPNAVSRTFYQLPLFSHVPFLSGCQISTDAHILNRWLNATLWPAIEGLEWCLLVLHLVQPDWYAWYHWLNATNKHLQWCFNLLLLLLSWPKNLHLPRPSSPPHFELLGPGLPASIGRCCSLPSPAGQRP